MSLINFTHRNLRLTLAGALLALAGGAIGATGCGGGDTTSLAGFCQALAEQDCSFAVVQACYASSDASLENDVGSCIAVRSTVAKCNPRSLPFHPEFGDACLEAHASAFANGNVDPETYAAMQDTCLAVFNNGGSEGAPCKTDVDCDVGNGFRCMVRVGGDGTCRVPVPVNPGDSCKDPAAQCADGYYCDAGFHCISKPATGEACGAGEPCGTGGWCNMQAMSCEAQFGNGKPCNDDSQCQGGFCLEVSGGGSQCASNYVFSFGAAACLDFTQ